MVLPGKAAIKYAVAMTLFFSGILARAQFETRGSFSTWPYSPISAVIGDFNRDGKLDLAVVSDLPPPGSVMIFLGNGDGTFTAGASYSPAVQPFFAATASLRKNGILDLVVGDTLSDYVYVMLGNGDGTFQPAIAYPTSGRPAVVGTGDFNNDGRLDIIALTNPAADCNCVEVLPGNGDGTFQAAVITPVPYDIDGIGIASGDFNGDGTLDVAVSGGFGSANQVDILLGKGDGTFSSDGYYPVSSSPSSIGVGRFTSSNNLDLAVGNSAGNSISVLLGNGNATFQQAVNYYVWEPWMAVGDLNGDGKEDLAASDYGSPNGTNESAVSVLLGNGDGTFQTAVSYPAGELLDYVAIGDFNGDHKLDLVAVDHLGDAVITLLNTGVVSFSPTTPLTFGPQLLGTSSPQQTVTLTNAGTTTLTISSISLQGGGQFSYSHTCGASVAPGGNCTISARSKPTTEGNTSGTITINDSASSKPMFVELAGAGTVVNLQPASLTFPTTKNGTKSKPQKVQLTNTGSTALDITSIAIGEGADFRDFYQSNNCGSSLNAGASCTINVIFAPRQTGSFSETVVITDSGGGSPQSIPLSGTGD
jgi:hypothetical protein